MVRQGTMLFLGHRGSSDRYPENTMLAFEKAVEEGAHGIEADVRKSADGHFVIMHDPTVDRTTDGTGAVAELTWDEIERLDAGAWKGAGFARQPQTRVPRLETLLDRFRHEPVFLCLQLKVELVDCLEVVEMVRARGMFDQTFIFTNEERLLPIRAAAPEAFVINDGMRHDPWELLERAQREKWSGISPGVRAVRPELINEANAHGLRVMASFLTGDYERRTRDLIEMGCHFILGNDCAQMVQVGKACGVQQIVP